MILEILNLLSFIPSLYKDLTLILLMRNNARITKEICMPKLTLEQFRDQFSNAPVDLFEMADNICGHLDPDDHTSSDSPALIEAAQKLRAAEEELLELMGELDIELG